MQNAPQKRTDMKASVTITKVTPDKVFLIDNDIGRSVTNDAEAVVAHIYNQFPNRRIIYRDTMGQWDELAHNHGIFTNFLPYREDV